MLFFFNDTATTEIYTLSLHDALPISAQPLERLRQLLRGRVREAAGQADVADARPDHEGVADGGLRDAAAADGEVERRLGARALYLDGDGLALRAAHGLRDLRRRPVARVLAVSSEERRVGT